MTNTPLLLFKTNNSSIRSNNWLNNSKGKALLQGFEDFKKRNTQNRCKSQRLFIFSRNS